VGAVPTTEECIPIVEKLYKEGVPVREIAKHCGNSLNMVYRALKRLLEQGRVERRVKKSGPHRRLTDEELETIARLYKEGVPVYRIAKELDRPVSTIYYALKRLGLRS